MTDARKRVEEAVARVGRCFRSREDAMIYIAVRDARLILTALSAAEAERDEARINLGNFVGWQNRAAAAEARNAELREALTTIRDQEEHEIALDPDWPRRIARKALEPKL